MSGSTSPAGPEPPPREEQSRPSDAGLAGERTMLAWSRLGMTLLGLPSALFAYAATQHVLAAAAAAVAAVAGLSLLTLSVRRQRVTPGFVVAAETPLAVGQVALTAVCVLGLAATSLVLVIG